jgi:hypothetical protein
MIYKMKFNWGIGIALICIGFVLLCVITTIIFMNQNVELVSNNYYDNEIKYQDNINTLKRTRDFHADVKIECSGSLITLQFPSFLNSKAKSGNIHFFRPSGEKNDFKVSVLADSNGSQIINSGGLIKGLWKVGVDWKSDNKRFYSEKSILIN